MEDAVLVLRAAPAVSPPAVAYRKELQETNLPG
jgi:hypothetical protein